MAYELQITIPDKEIELDEWINAVELVDGVKIDSSDVEIVNPITNEVFSMPGGEGDVSVLINGNWEKCLRFSRGRGSFNARRDIEDPFNPVRIAAAMIAKTLGAVITGEEGEVYEW